MEGLHVVDLASFIAGPAAAAVLGDFGADVVKVEPPHVGDAYRSLSRIPPNPHVEGINYPWQLDNRNKRSIALNLKSPGARPVLESLVRWADVLVTNFPPRTREKLGLEYDALAPLNPRLIYADLDDHKITAMPVVDRRGDLVGVVSEADLLQDALQLDDRVPTVAVRVSASAAQRRVAEVMTHLVVSVHVDDDLDTAIDLLRSTMVKSLPVLQQGRVVGMISQSDVIHLLAGRDQGIRGDVADLLRRENLDWQVEVGDGVVKANSPSVRQVRRQTIDAR